MRDGDITSTQSTGDRSEPLRLHDKSLVRERAKDARFYFARGAGQTTFMLYDIFQTMRMGHLQMPNPNRACSSGEIHSVLNTFVPTWGGGEGDEPVCRGWRKKPINSFLTGCNPAAVTTLVPNDERKNQLHS